MSDGVGASKIGKGANGRSAIAGAVIVLFVLFVAIACQADDTFIIRPASGNISDIANRHNLTVIRALDSRNQVFLVDNTSGETADQMEMELDADSTVATCEFNTAVAVTEGATLNQSTGAILDGLPPLAAVSFFGSTVPNYYLVQPATSIMHLSTVQSKMHITGAGIVAIIDTGVDPNHPTLASSLLPGYDFVHDWSGTASEFVDLPSATSAVLNQSTGAILDSTHIAIVNQSTAAILDQSTGAILDSTQLPAAFGHGTMVAGIVHLVAPTAQIMPLKAFSANGTGQLADILRAIYYAADHNAAVINMSFSLPDASPELVSAINYAVKRGVVPVASVGNTGQMTVSYPAAISNVIGVGSTSNLDVRSTFSSYGSMVNVGAPGEGILTTYPGGHYAAAWGTSFSAPFVAGTAALVEDVESGLKVSDVSSAIGHHAKSVSQMGKGRIDIYEAVDEFF